MLQHDFWGKAVSNRVLLRLWLPQRNRQMWHQLDHGELGRCVFFQDFGVAQKRGCHIITLWANFFGSPSPRKMSSYFFNNYLQHSLKTFIFKIIFNERFGKWNFITTLIFELVEGSIQNHFIPGLELVRLVSDQIARNSLGQGALFGKMETTWFLKDLHIPQFLWVELSIFFCVEGGGGTFLSEALEIPDI